MGEGKEAGNSSASLAAWAMLGKEGDGGDLGPGPCLLGPSYRS